MKIIKRPDRKRMKNEISFKLNERTKAEEKKRIWKFSEGGNGRKEMEVD